MARPKDPHELKSFTCYLPRKDLARAKKIAGKQMTNPSSIIRRAVNLGLTALEKGSPET